MKFEINPRSKKSKVVNVTERTILLKLYGKDFKIWRQGNILDQNYWDSDVKNNITAVGTDSYIGTDYNGSFADWLFRVQLDEITQIRYSLLKKTRDYILVRIDKI